ncbi:MAG: S41 family peptidase [Planctomycetaceae bacterium]|nr:S41 family peptidase [Planctomycetaceae bacterium]
MDKLLQRMAWSATVAFLVVAAWAQVVRAEDEQKQPDEYYALMKVLVDTFEQIDRNYVKDVDRRELVEAAVRGMLAELDPYSDYISPDDLTKFTEAVEQEFGGVGIQVQWNPDDRSIMVMTPFPGSPAYKAGVRAGDKIVEIEGEQVKDFPTGEEISTAVGLLKGPPGVEVTVGVRHLDSEEVETVKMTRDVIRLDTVMGDQHKADGSWNFILDGESKIGYLRITHFTKRTASELQTALRQLRDQGMKGLVLDLRFNPGGLLQAAVEVCDLFIENGMIVSTEGRNVKPQKWTAKPLSTFKDFPMAVLVNRYSASASEIVSACLQDHHRAVVVGERTWGKGSVQNVVELEGGHSALKLTTAAYHRPSGKNIHRFPNAEESDEWGVMPDTEFLIEFTPKELSEYHSYRQKRDLPPESVPERPEFDDRQLAKALEYISEQLTKDQQTVEKPAGEAADNPPAPAEKSKDAAALPIQFLRIPRTFHG